MRRLLPGKVQFMVFNSMPSGIYPIKLSSSNTGHRNMKSHERGGSIILVACMSRTASNISVYPLLQLTQTAISAHRVNYPQPQVAYNVSKAGVLHLTHCLAAEWARYGIRINSISPGYMDTILNEGAGLENARNAWAARNPMGRMGVPQELCGPIVLLCSQAGSFMNGADLVVDGEYGRLVLDRLSC